jgi:hypothetical protein
MTIKILRLITHLINGFHDLLRGILSAFGFAGDKEQHFIVIGFIGIALFFGLDAIIKLLAKWRLEAVSFLITGILLLVLVFGIEIVQLETGSGAVEFRDIMAGLWGFLFFFCIYLAVRYVYHKVTRSRRER